MGLKLQENINKYKKNQIIYAILITILAIIFGFYLDNIALFWFFGLAFGYIIQRYGFCFTAAFRDPYLFGTTSSLRALLVAIAISTIGLTMIKYNYYLASAEYNLNMVGVAPIGLPLIIGAFIFGVGMVISGGCASGTLVRIGEGFTLKIITLFFFIIGILVGAHNNTAFWAEFNQNAPRIFLPDVFGWLGALLAQALIIVSLYILAVIWQKKKFNTQD